MKNRNKKQIIVSGLCLGTALLLLGYSSWAWYMTSRTVKATGITLNAKLPDNMEISLTGQGNEWLSELTVSAEEVLKSQIPDYDDTKKFFILPASSYGGFEDTLFATSRAKTDGSAYDDTVFYKGGGIAYSAQSGFYSGYYLDVPLYFRNMGEGSMDVRLDTGGSTFVSNDASDIYKIARAAFLSESKNKNSAGGSEPLVFADEGRNTPTVVTSSVDKSAVPEYLTFDGATNMSNQTLFTLESYDGTNNSVKKLFVRIWIEGQDSACTVSVGNKSFTLDLKFSAM